MDLDLDMFPDESVRVRTVADIEALGPEAKVLFVHGLDDEKARALCRLKHLRAVYQDGQSTVTDAGIEALRSAGTLESLDLQFSCDITEKGLSCLAGLESLRWLDLGGCDRLTEEDVTRVRSMLPTCQVVH